MRDRPFPLPLLVLTLGGVACSVKAPPSSTWALAPTARSAPPVVAPGEPRLGVGGFSSSPDVRTTAMAWREGGGTELRRARSHQWADYPDRMLRELTVARLAASGRFGSVREAPPTRGLDAVLGCHVLDFSDWRSGERGEVRVALRCTVEGPDGRVLEVLHGSGRAASPSGDPAGVVEAYSAASVEAVDAIGRELTEALRVRPPAPPS